LLVGLGATRVIQRWLELKYLPATQLDAGLRNSIKTGFGYLGFGLAGVLAFSQLGVSFDRLTIVAGALSVGIGFGLQSVVNNFVSGLILLWERPIKVGDWVVVGSEQGYVRRINVRSTEIETFDRASVIVPNSNLISGVVKNWVHHNRTGRISVQVTVAFMTEPEKVEAILIDCARRHKDVLKEPKPSVFFNKFSDTSLEFEMRCFIGDVELSQRVKSELHFAIFMRLKADGIYIAAPVPKSEVKVNLPEHLEDVLFNIAETRAAEASARQSEVEAPPAGRKVAPETRRARRS
jgi:small-conductance mechanosensitive channel